ncbi:hypothetical protein D0499_05465 [Weissella soli]|uniref:hypothetical protein n=1 Tax=Weissella soli TaxID=155866 RepID=UPI0021C0F4EB|nr:hypothetical protein [Weissella soli]MCT8395258.1 hypothetical protein [Weissella soli]
MKKQWAIKIGNDWFAGFGPKHVVWTAWFERDAELYTAVGAQQTALHLIKLGHENVAYIKVGDDYGSNAVGA